MINQSRYGLTKTCVFAPAVDNDAQGNSDLSSVDWEPNNGRRKRNADNVKVEQVTKNISRSVLILRNRCLMGLIRDGDFGTTWKNARDSDYLNQPAFKMVLQKTSTQNDVLLNNCSWIPVSAAAICFGVCLPYKTYWYYLASEWKNSSISLLQNDKLAEQPETNKVNSCW